jgi:TRAP-type C4-dicarboxylate transport system permease small subunit
MKRVQRLLAWAFGAIFVALSVVVSVETLTRKVFNYSIQGADELGGYALAAGSVIAFSLALIGRNHIRVDVFHEHFPRRMQAWLNALSYVLLAAFAVLLAVVAFKVVADTLAYRSTAPTPWQTPLIWPQSVWYAGLVVFRAACRRLCGARRVAACARRHRQGQPRLPAEECEGRGQGGARRLRATARRTGCDAAVRRIQVYHAGGRMTLAIPAALIFLLMLATMLVGMPIAVSMAAVGILGGVAAFGDRSSTRSPRRLGHAQREPAHLRSAVRAARRAPAALGHRRPDVHRAVGVARGLPGGLLHTNIGACALFAATSGSSVATAATIGTVALPPLYARGYSMRASLGTLAAGGTLGILIPPSINMIVYGSLTNNSIGNWFIWRVSLGLA